MLPIKDMFRLYRLIGKHLPQDEPDPNGIIDYVGKIIDSMKATGNPGHFVDAILLMHNKKIEDVKDLTPPQIIKLFVDGFADNRVLEFRNFIVSIGFNNG